MKKYGFKINNNLWLGNLALASLYLFYVYSNTLSLMVSFKLSVLLLLIFNTFIFALAFIRRAPINVTKSPFDYIIALCGTMSPMFFIGLPVSNDHFMFLALQVFGICFSFAGLMSLSRSFGLVPANRGIVTTGLYKYVRHPLYTGYVLLFSGFLFQNLSIRNLISFLVFVIFESLRILLEEQFLSTDRSYQEYTKKVRWRIIPYIW